jgi:hypothetical protein
MKKRQCHARTPLQYITLMYATDTPFSVGTPVLRKVFQWLDRLAATLTSP